MLAERLHSNFVLGYHGCRKEVGERLIQGEPFKKSENDYDWLGHGVYFWESNPDRALSFIRDANRRKGLPDADAFVVGAVIDLYLVIERVLGLTSLSERPLFLVGFLLIIIGVQFVSIGLLGEMITRQERDEEVYSIRDMLN